MTHSRLTFLLAAALLFGACAEEAPPRTVTEFMDDQLLLEAVLLRCTENRAESRYDAECVNAREAVARLEARAEEARKAELEALSQRKREALRRTQQAAAEARRRAAQAEQQRAELEYQAQFGLPMPAGEGNPDAMLGNEPVVMLPGADAPAGSAVTTAPAGEPPVAAAVPPQPEEPVDQSVDLESIRKEMRRRTEEERSGP